MVVQCTNAGIQGLTSSDSTGIVYCERWFSCSINIFYSYITNKTLEQEQNNTLKVLDITINRCNVESEWQLRISLYVGNPELQIVLFPLILATNIPWIGFC
jgi:hypothetical protein